jgi:hypothetical protein
MADRTPVYEKIFGQRDYRFRARTDSCAITIMVTKHNIVAVLRHTEWVNPQKECMRVFSEVVSMSQLGIIVARL